MTASCPFEYVAFAEQLVAASGPIVRRYYEDGAAIEDKPDASPVTEADKAAEAVIRKLINQRYPDHGIIGEEYGREKEDAEWVWVLDPIDGTKAFIVHKLTFGTLVALMHNGRSVLGVIDQPILQHRWIGAHGRPTLCNGKPVRTRACDELSEARINTTAADLFDDTQFGQFRAVASQGKFSHWGGDCYGFGLVASGYIDLSIEAGLKLHDHAALPPVIEGAGGAVVDWQGKPLDKGSDGTILAAGDRRLVDPVLKILNG